jgi:hypothetical protein
MGLTETCGIWWIRAGVRTDHETIVDKDAKDFLLHSAKSSLSDVEHSVEVLGQAQQSCTIKTGELGLDICPRGLRFKLTSDHVPVRFYQRSRMDGAAGVNSEQVILGHPVLPVADGLGG